MTASVLSVAGAALVLLVSCASARSLPPPAFAHGPSADELLGRAEASEGQGDSVRAEQYAVAAIARGAAEDRVTRFLVRVCLLADRPRSALRYTLASLAHHPDDVALQYVAAVIQQALGDDVAALRSAEVLTRSHPSFAPGFYVLGLALREQGDLEGARTAFATLLQLDPANRHAPEAGAFVVAPNHATRAFVVTPNHATLPTAVPKRTRGRDDTRRRIPTDAVRGS